MAWGRDKRFQTICGFRDGSGLGSLGKFLMEHSLDGQTERRERKEDICYEEKCKRKAELLESLMLLSFPCNPPSPPLKGAEFLSYSKVGRGFL